MTAQTKNDHREPDAGNSAASPLVIHNDAILEDQSRVKERQQFAALPYRISGDGGLEILLITSRTSRRWIIPKGWPMGQLAPHKVAALEAMEEAGVLGRIEKQSIGLYRYDKLLASGVVASCSVEVFPLGVRKQKASWPERKRRERQWVGVDEAILQISDADLVPIIRSFSQAYPPIKTMPVDAPMTGNTKKKRKI